MAKPILLTNAASLLAKFASPPTTRFYVGQILQYGHGHYYVYCIILSNEPEYIVIERYPGEEFSIKKHPHQYVEWHFDKSTTTLADLGLTPEDIERYKAEIL